MGKGNLKKETSVKFSINELLFPKGEINHVKEAVQVTEPRPKRVFKTKPEPEPPFFVWLTTYLSLGIVFGFGFIREFIGLVKWLCAWKRSKPSIFNVY
jgi:hypothetical protein